MRGLKDGGRDVYQPNPSVDSRADVPPGKLEQQRNVDGFVVEKDAVMVFSMLSERFAVVSHDRDESGIE
jgi:hypothetical protein